MKKKLFRLKSFSLILLISAILIPLAACDTFQELTTYSINVEISGLEEGARDDLLLHYNGEIADQLNYNEGVFKIKLSNLRGSKEIEPNMSGEDFYPEKIKVNSNDNNKTISFNATTEKIVSSNLQDRINEAGPGDTLIVQAGSYPVHVSIPTPGLKFKALEVVDDSSRIGGITISANDVTIKDFDFIAGGSLEIIDSKDIKILNNFIEENSNAAIEIDNSTVLLKDNESINNETAIKVKNNSNVEMIGNIIEADNKIGLDINNSKAHLSGNSFRNNDVGLSASESTLTLDDNSFRNNIVGIDIENGIETLITNNRIEGNSTLGINIKRGEDAIIEDNNDITNNNIGIFVENNDANISENNIKFNTSEGIEVINNSHVNINDNEIASNEYGIRVTDSVSNIQNNEISSNEKNIIIKNSKAEIKKNQIEANKNGILIFGENSVEDSKVNNNNFRFFSEKAIIASKELDSELDTEAKLDATNNYWGKDTATEIEALLIGEIIFEPFSQERLQLNK